MSLLRPRLVRDRLLLGLGVVALALGIGLLHSQLSIMAVHAQFDQAVELDQATARALATLERSIREMLRIQTAYAINGGSQRHAAVLRVQSLIDPHLDKVREATQDDPQALRLTETIEHNLYRWIGEVSAVENQYRTRLDQSERRIALLQEMATNEESSSARLTAAIEELDRRLPAQGKARSRLRQIAELHADAHTDYQTFLLTASTSEHERLMKRISELRLRLKPLEEMLSGNGRWIPQLAGLLSAHEEWELQEVFEGTRVRLEQARSAISPEEIATIVYRNRDSERFTALFNGLAALDDHLAARTAERQVAAAHNAHTSHYTSVASALVALLIGGLWIRRVTQEVSVPIENLGLGFRKIGEGVADFRLPADEADELGELTRSFNSMAELLSLNMVSRRFLETVLNSMNDVLIVANSQGTLTLVNQKGAELTGREQAELISSSLRDIFDSESEALPLAEQLVDSDGPLEFRVGLRGEEESIPVAVSASLMEQAGADSEVVYVARDMRQTDALIRDLQKTREELFRHERLAALGQVLGTVSHELRNPLATISASLFLLERTLEAKEPRTVEVIDRAVRNIRRCERIIEELLDFSRAQEPRRQRENVDDWLRKQLEEIPIPEGVSLIPTLNASVMADFDSHQIGRCIDNLVQNAAQAVESRDSAARITVGTARVSDRIEIEIHDNGPGIPTEDLERVFEPLFSTKPFGVGLGLPMVRRTMQMHGGDVEIESDPGRGTTVRLWFPQHHE